MAVVVSGIISWAPVCMVISDFASPLLEYGKDYAHPQKPALMIVLIEPSGLVSRSALTSP